MNTIINYLTDCIFVRRILTLYNYHQLSFVILHIILKCPYKKFTGCLILDECLSTGQMLTNFGFYNGRLTRIDDPHTGAGVHHSGSHIHPEGHMGTMGNPAGSFFGLNPLAALGSALRSAFMGSQSPPRCPGLICTASFVPSECRFMPVMRTAFGMHCLGCEDDICEIGDIRARPGQRRRRRIIRRRLCREFGVCALSGRRRGGGSRRGRRA